MPTTKSVPAEALHKAPHTSKTVLVKSRTAKVMTPDELRRDMLAYGDRVASTKQSALAFLKRIGAPVKA